MTIHLQKIFAIRRPFRNVLNLWRHASIHVTPSTPSHVSEILKITGNGFAPHLKLTIQGQLNCASEYLDFQSYAHVKTDSEGCFDLCTTASVGGTYTGVDVMGLFWSMMKNGGVSRMHINNGEVRLKYNFNVYENQIDRFDEDVPVLCSTSVERFLVYDSVIRDNVKVGRVRGTLFIPGGKGPFPAIIVLHGGTKKKKPIEQDAALLANQGYVTLALPFYGVADLPKMYTDGPIDIEYFEEAIDWLCSLECVISSEIGVLGHSKGGDISLAIAEHLRQVKAVCSVSGCIASVLTTTKYKDKITSMLPHDYSRITLNDDNSLCMKNIYDDISEDSVHKFETSSASFLFIVGLDDQSLDVVQFTDIAEERMDGFGKTNYEIVKYEGLGHCIDIPYAPVCTHASHPIVPREVTIFYGGKNKRMHKEQQLKFWKDIFQFFETSLSQIPTSKL